MQIIKITNSTIRDIVKKHTATDKTKNLLNMCVNIDSLDWVNFVHEQFLKRPDTFQPLFNPMTYIGQVKPEDIAAEFSKVLPKVRKKDIYAVNKLDILHGVSWPVNSDFNNTKLFVDIYSQIEDIDGYKVAVRDTEEVYNCLLDVLSYVEILIFNNVIRNDDNAHMSYYMHVANTNGYLLICVF